MLRQNTNHSERGYVLSITPYRESDGMVHFLGESSGLIRLILPGYYKAQSKQGSLGLEFTYVRYRFNPRAQKLNRIIGGEMIQSYSEYRTNMSWLLNMSLVRELVIKTFSEEQDSWTYHSFESFMDNPVSTLSIVTFLKTLIVRHGFVPDISGCVVCGSPRINEFSVKQGGFLCQEHSHRQDTKYMLMMMKGLFSNKDVSDYANEGSIQSVLERLLQYVEYYFDIHLKTWELMKEMGEFEV